MILPLPLEGTKNLVGVCIFPCVGDLQSPKLSRNLTSSMGMCVTQSDDVSATGNLGPVAGAWG